jgi:hypothetical protein
VGNNRNSAIALLPVLVKPVHLVASYYESSSRRSTPVITAFTNDAFSWDISASLLVAFTSPRFDGRYRHAISPLLVFESVLSALPGDDCWARAVVLVRC